jgi:small subunit ribosomal protein S10
MEKTNAKIRVRLESFNHELLVSSCQKIVNILQNTPLNSIGVITLPTRKRIYCVLRSPHVDKDSREHFEIRIHKRILEIYYDSEVPIFDLLSEADLTSRSLLSYLFILSKKILLKINK